MSMTIVIPDHLVKIFQDFIEVHVELYHEVDDGSTPEQSELIELLDNLEFK